MEIKKRISISIIIGIILILGFYIITNAITKYTGFVSDESEGNDFEICLKEQDINLYVNTEDIAHSLKNIQLKDYLQYAKITNCLRNNQACAETNVNSFPTWIINNNKTDKDISFQELAEFSGCRLINQE